jgi:hypothetical protein
MGIDYDDDFTLNTGKRGGGGRKQPKDKKRQEKQKNQAPTCYSSKHIRAKESLLSKKQNEPK